MDEARIRIPEVFQWLNLWEYFCPHFNQLKYKLHFLLLK